MFLRCVVSGVSLVALITVSVSQATACENHSHGHQNSAEQSQVQGPRENSVPFSHRMGS